MQRRAFIIFIKTIFLGFLLGDPVSTPHSLRSGFRCGDNPDIFRLALLSGTLMAVCLRRRLALSLVADPHQNILAEPQAIWKMIHLTSREPSFYTCAWKRCPALCYTRTLSCAEVLWCLQTNNSPFVCASKQTAKSVFERSLRRINDKLPKNRRKTETMASVVPGKPWGLYTMCVATCFVSKKKYWSRKCRWLAFNGAATNKARNRASCIFYWGCIWMRGFFN